MVMSQAPVLHIRACVAHIDGRLEIQERAAMPQGGEEVLYGPIQELAMRNGEQERVQTRELFPRIQAHAVLSRGILRRDERVVKKRVDPELVELAHDVDDLRIPEIGHVLLE